MPSGKLTSAECPYCPGPPFGWGMEPEGWAEMKRQHDAGHPPPLHAPAPIPDNPEFDVDMCICGEEWPHAGAESTEEER